MPLSQTWAPDAGAAASEDGWKAGDLLSSAVRAPARHSQLDLVFDEGLIFSGPAVADPTHDPLARFARSNHFEHLLRDVVSGADISFRGAPRIAILSAGTGENGVSPCLRLFPDARLVAADENSGQLAHLKVHLQESGALDRVTLVQAAADASFLRPGGVDLIVGVGALSRLIDPDRAIAEVARALRPGGHAILIEPFDGYGLLRIAFGRILAEEGLRDEKLEEPVRMALLSLIEDIAARTAPDPASPGFADRCEKWLFAREFLAAAARNVGFSDVKFLAHNDHASLYRDLGVLRVAERVGAAGTHLPDWALAILEQFDQALTPAVKRLLIVEGTVVLTR